MPKAYISAVAHYVPEKVLTNFDLEKWSIPATSGFGRGRESENDTFLSLAKQLLIWPLKQ